MSTPIFENVSWMNKAGLVPEINVGDLSQENFEREYVDRNMPVVIRGAVRHWPAVERWRHPAYLTSQIGGYEVNIYPHVNFTSPERQRKGERRVRFSDALNLLHSSDTAEWTVPSVVISTTEFAELLCDIGDLHFLKNAKNGLMYPNQRYFMYKGGGTAWHQHPCDETLLCQIVGEKKIGLLKGDSGQNNVVREIFSKETYWDDRGCFSAASVEKLNPYVATIAPGDALYIPPFWWHGIAPTSVGFGASMAKCWRSPSHIGGDVAIPAVRDLWLRALSRPGKLTGQLAKMTILSALKKLL